VINDYQETARQGDPAINIILEQMCQPTMSVTKNYDQRCVWLKLSVDNISPISIS